jgi:hypothetical protein
MVRMTIKEGDMVYHKNHGEGKVLMVGCNGLSIVLFRYSQTYVKTAELVKVSHGKRI